MMRRSTLRKAALIALPALALNAVLPLYAASLPDGVELRAYLDDACIVSDEPYFIPPEEGEEIARAFPLTGVVVGKLAAALLNSVVKATVSGLDGRSRARDLHYVAAYDFDMYRATLSDSPGYTLNGELSCVTVVAASFEPAGADCTDRYVPKTVSADAPPDADLAAYVDRDDDTVENVLRRANVCVVGDARSVFEARISFSDDRTAFRLDGAGLWVRSLLSTDSRRATRSLIYTFDISEPAADSTLRTLVTGAVKIGEVRAGTVIENAAALTRSDWLAIPPLSYRAAAAYEQATSVHQDVYAEIGSLERAVLRNRRLLEGLRERFDDASEGIRDALKMEMERIELKLLQTEAMLDARRAEYAALPQPDSYFMPVTIGVGVIESRSENRALATLSAFLEEHRPQIVDAAMEAGADRFERSVNPAGDETRAADSSLAEARTAYYDALVAVEEAQAAGSAAETEMAELERTRRRFNEERARLGIPEVE